MKFQTDRESLLRPLQLVTGVVERRQTLPVLSNLLISAGSQGLSITGTDLEVELVAEVPEVSVEEPGQVTIPARKLTDIWRSLPDGATVKIEVSGDRVTLRSGRSRFTLSTLPAGDFPKIDSVPGEVEFSLPQQDIRRLLEQVSFSMAQQDVRYFLNGMLLEVTDDHIRSVATDGHRMAMCTLNQAVPVAQRVQAIVPRKGVIEMGRLLDDESGDVALQISDNHLRLRSGAFTLTTKLVDGKFPDYEKVIPRDSNQVLTGDRETLRQAFHRAAILSNEKYRGVRLTFGLDQLTVQANNPEQEEAEETVPVDYSGTQLEIGFNVSYLQDVLGALGTESVRLSVSDANSSALIEGDGNDTALYVIMPMRL
jgi:DNA polymerase-3 subunit beta